MSTPNLEKARALLSGPRPKTFPQAVALIAAAAEALAVVPSASAYAPAASAATAAAAKPVGAMTGAELLAHYAKLHGPERAAFFQQHRDRLAKAYTRSQNFAAGALS